MADLNDGVAVYAWDPVHGYLLLAVAGSLVLAGCIGLIVSVVSTHAVVFTVVVSVGLILLGGASAYTEAYLVSNTLASDGNILRWSGMRRQGTWSLGEVATIRRGGLNGQYVVFENTDGERFFARPGRGWDSFAAVVAPDRPADAASRPHRFERGIGRSHFDWRGDWPSR